jgi:hypothetical protein
LENIYNKHGLRMHPLTLVVARLLAATSLLCKSPLRYHPHATQANPLALLWAYLVFVLRHSLSPIVAHNAG